MVEDSFRKEFDIFNPETNTTIKVTMSIGDYIKHKQMENLIRVIARLNNNG